MVGFLRLASSLRARCDGGISLDYWAAWRRAQRPAAPVVAFINPGSPDANAGNVAA
jgi:hypothetical protein